MLEELFQPTHLLVTLGIALLVFGPEEASRTRQRHLGGYPWLQVSHERRKEAGQRQTHHRGRPKLTDEAKTNVRSARDISGTDSTNNLFFEEI
jgi:hypothetical protein